MFMQSSLAFWDAQTTYMIFLLTVIVLVQKWFFDTHWYKSPLLFLRWCKDEPAAPVALRSVRGINIIGAVVSHCIGTMVVTQPFTARLYHDPTVIITSRLLHVRAGGEKGYHGRFLSQDPILPSSLPSSSTRLPQSFSTLLRHSSRNCSRQF
jgi:hypothetical protein